MDTTHLRKESTAIALWILGILTVLALAGQMAFPLGRPVSLPAGMDLDAIRTGFAQGQILVAALVLWVIARAGGSRLAIIFGAIYAASWGIEALGVHSGIPFGAYSYTHGLGAFLPGSVPWAIPLSWATSSLAVHLFLRLYAPGSGTIGRVLAGSVLLLAWDLVLDPAMTSVFPLWTWATKGFWYGVPLSNLAGWYACGLAFLAILEAGKVPVERMRASHLGVFLVLQMATPLAMVAMAGYWMAVVASAAMVLYVMRLLQGHRDPSQQRGVPLDPSDRLDFMARHSRSFRFASSFLSRNLREVVGGVYCWCRVTDDLVDEAVGLSRSQVAERLDGWERLSRRAYDGESSGSALLNDVFGRMAAQGIPFQVAADLIEGMRMDLDPRSFETPEELRRYSYRVASTVGIWVTRSAGVDDPCVLECAEALGHAMQLTNILRDVGEDFRRGRVYLPMSDLRAAGLSEADLGAYADGIRPIDAAWRSLMETLMARADADYRLALLGMPYLPASLRTAVAVASEVYRGIHQAVRRNGYDNFRKRAATGRLEKLGLALRGWWKSARLHPWMMGVPGLVGGGR